MYVATVLLGAIATYIAVRWGIDTKAMQSVEGEESSFKSMPTCQAAEIIIQGISKDRVHILVGLDAKFMNFHFRLSPKFATNYITKQMGSLRAE